MALQAKALVGGSTLTGGTSWYCKPGNIQKPLLNNWLELWIVLQRSKITIGPGKFNDTLFPDFVHGHRLLELVESKFTGLFVLRFPIQIVRTHTQD
jgi:hypothetical protein